MMGVAIGLWAGLAIYGFLEARDRLLEWYWSCPFEDVVDPELRKVFLR